MPPSTPAPTRRPDAVRVPKHHFPLRPREDEARRVTNELAATFREPRSYLRPRIDVPEPGEVYAVPFSAGHNETLNFPHGHPFHGESRYDWFVARRDEKGVYVPVAPETGHPGEERRVKVGYLKPDPYAADPAVHARIQEELDARLEELARSPEVLARLRALGHIVDDEAQGETNAPAQ
jgi:hypothetical protein